MVSIDHPYLGDAVTTMSIERLQTSLSFQVPMPSSGVHVLQCAQARGMSVALPDVIASFTFRQREIQGERQSWMNPI